MHNLLYDISKTFYENIQLGPQFSGTIAPRTSVPQSQWIDFLGYKLASPIGASACPVMMGKGIELLSQLGFDVLTYKTVRSTMYEGHPFPNVVFVDPISVVSGTARACDNQTGVLANSIGNVSLDPEWMMRDIAYARSCIRAGQVLIVSVYGQASAQRSLIEDFVHTARMVESAGAHVIELNLSCPNVRTGDVLYKDADMVQSLGSAVVQAVSVPVIFKCGTFPSRDEMANVMVAAGRAGLRGIVGINTRPMPVVSVFGDPAFGRNREVAGVSGAPLYNDALQFVTWASDIIKNNKLDMIIVGMGGIVKADQFNGLLRAGARIALTATGMLCNPYIAAEYHEMSMIKQSIGKQLCTIESIKFGDFVFKSGIRSSNYVDMRRVVSYPHLMHELASALSMVLRDIECDYLCGVPLAALPLATAVSMKSSVPMIMCRPEVKSHGTKQKIEGVFQAGKRCVIMEDVITTGGSILQTIENVEAAGLIVEDIIVVVDRQQGGREALAERGYTLHSLFTLSELMTLQDSENVPARQSLSYGQRAQLCQHPVARRLFEVMERKQTNLALAADVTTKHELLEYAHMLGSKMCMLKLHIDSIKDFDQDVIVQLKECAARYDFVICEDRKFADIGNTVRQQYAGGIYSIADWADIVTVHALPGSGIIEALRQEGLAKERACVVIAQMSSDGNLVTPDYTHRVVSLCSQYDDFVIGCVAQQSVSDDPRVLHMTPGVKLQSGGDDVGQRYTTPRDVIARGSDMIIVGRGILHADDPVGQAELYRADAWNAYMDRLRD